MGTNAVRWKLPFQTEEIDGEWMESSVGTSVNSMDSMDLTICGESKHNTERSERREITMWKIQREHQEEDAHPNSVRER